MAWIAALRRRPDLGRRSAPGSHGRLASAPRDEGRLVERRGGRVDHTRRWCDKKKPHTVLTWAIVPSRHHHGPPGPGLPSSGLAHSGAAAVTSPSLLAVAFDVSSEPPHPASPSRKQGPRATRLISLRVSALGVAVLVTYPDSVSTETLQSSPSRRARALIGFEPRSARDCSPGSARLMGAEGAIALTLGVLAGSIALIGFGSTVSRVFASLVIVWRFTPVAAHSGRPSAAPSAWSLCSSSSSRR